MEENNFVGKLHFSFISDLETTTLDKEYHEEPEDFETIFWYLEEFVVFCIKSDIKVTFLK